MPPEDGAKQPLPLIPGYKILRLLGEGGMGRVYLAQDELLGRTVAVKVVSERFLDRPEARQRFQREARSMATVEHPNVVRVYSFAEGASGAYLVMEYVEGDTLSERLRRGRLPVEEALAILREVVDGLEAAWEKQLVHRDVKPGNVLLDRKGHAHVSDFGLAKPVASAGDASLTDTGAILGTPFYVSPEQARGRPVDHRSDIYSAGIMAFEMLAGDPPFKGTTSFEVVAKHLHEPLPDLRQRRPELPETLVRTLEWMAAKEPASRPPSYAALRQALAAPSQATPAADSAMVTRFDDRGSVAASRPRRFKRGAPAIAAATVVLGLIGGALWSERRPPPPDAKQLVVAVAPFYGVDAASAAEGQTLAGLVEREVVRRLGAEGARVLGVEETRAPVRDHASARALGERLGASVVVWGDAYAAGGQAELQPSFTLVPRGDRESSGALRSALAGRDPTEALQQMSAAARTPPPQGASQIELRRTTAAGVGDLVLLLAGMHRLYNQADAQNALSLFERVPRSPESQRHRAEALWRLGRSDAAFAALRDALQLDPKDAMSHATLGDLLLESGRLADGEKELRAAALLGGPYSTRNGIVFEDKLYVRETYLGRASNSASEQTRLDSGYMLALDPATDRVLERHRLPGVQSLRFSVRDGVLNLDFKEPRPASATFARGRYERPVFYSTYLLGRRRGIASGRALAANFMVGDVWALKPEPERKDPAPVTLDELELALRRAIDRDPTQPWLPLLLGQTLSAQGRPDEAERAWTSVFAGAFPATPYFEYAFMARFFEALPQPRWADRAYAEALRRRQAMPQPIAATTLIERLVSLPFSTAAAEASRGGGDLLRAHLWLVRARELSGIALESEALAAAAWQSYFQGRGDAAAAAAEREVVRRAGGAFRLDGASGRLDAAALLLIAASFSSWLLLGLMLRRRPGAGFSERLAGLSSRERRVLVAALGLCGVAHLAAVDARLEMLAFEELPLGFLDGIANAENVLLLEQRLAKLDSLPVRSALAIANHMAGNVERARELYERMPENPRTRRNWNAILSGARTPPEPLRAEDVIRAHRARRPLEWVPPRLLEIFWDRRPSVIALSALMALSRVLDLALAVWLAIALSVVPARAGEGPFAERPRPGLPGSAHLALGRPATAYLVALGVSFALLVAASQLAGRPAIPSLGPVSADYQAGLRGFPLPFPQAVTAANEEQLQPALRVFYWDFLRTRPEVLALWVVALVAGVAGVSLQLRALGQWKAASVISSPQASLAPVTVDATEDSRRSRPA